MRIIKLDISENAKTSANVADIDNIHFCMGIIEKFSDTDNFYISLLYAANLSNGETICFIQNFSIEPKELENNSILYSGLFIFNNKVTDMVLRDTISFFIDNKHKYITDFNMTYNTDTKRYEFYSDDDKDDDSAIKFTISKSVSVGLNMILFAMFNNRINRDSITDANDWLSNRIDSHINAEFCRVNELEVLDKSKTNKQRKNLHHGVAAIKFKVSTSINIDKEYVCVMPFSINKSIRDRYKTKDIKLMEIIYKDAYTINRNRGIYLYGGDEETVQLIAYKDDNEVILEIDKSKMKNCMKL